MTRSQTVAMVTSMIRSELPDPFKGIKLTVRQMGGQTHVIIPPHRVNGVDFPKMTVKHPDPDTLAVQAVSQITEHVGIEA